MKPGEERLANERQNQEKEEGGEYPGSSLLRKLTADSYLLPLNQDEKVTVYIKDAEKMFSKMACMLMERLAVSIQLWLSYARENALASAQDKYFKASSEFNVFHIII